MTRLLFTTGALAARHPWRVVCGWFLTAVLVLVLAGTMGGTLADDHTLPGTDSQAATDLLAERFPERAGATARIVLHGNDIDEAVLEQVAERAGVLDDVVGVAPAQVSPDGTTAVLTVQYDEPVTGLDPPAALHALEEAAAPARAAGLQTEFGGQVVDQIFEPGRSEGLGFAVAAVILLVVFGSVLAAMLPLAVAGVGLGVGMSLVFLLANVASIATVAPTMSAMVGIGVGIDYALLVLSRHRQQLLDGMDVRTSIALANATAGRSVAFAGGTVLVALCGLALSGVPQFVMMGVATALVVAVAVLAAVTLLPALLALCGTRVLRRRAALGGRASRRTPVAARWGWHVTRHPWTYGLASLVLLLALAAPMLAMDLGQADAGSDPTSTTHRRAYDLVETGFGAGANGPLLVAVDLREGPVDLPALQERLASTDGVAGATPALLNAAGDTAVLTVVPFSGPQENATDELVGTLRDDVLPVNARVTGATAGFMDFNQVMQDNLPRVVAAVVLTSFLLLVFVFRSVVAPLKAAVMNLLSVGAAYGAIVALFQWGWGADVLGLDQAVPVSAFVPVFMFAVLFGLSMDYEVFLLSRVREEWDRTADGRGSVIAGLTATGRVITCAAVIMVAVFAGFALNDMVAVKMMGVGMAAAILVDATLVRLVLVPSTMVLLGRWNWWLPGWLDRRLPATGLAEAAATPVDLRRSALV